MGTLNLWIEWLKDVWQQDITLLKFVLPPSGPCNAMLCTCSYARMG